MLAMLTRSQTRPEDQVRSRQLMRLFVFASAVGALLVPGCVTASFGLAGPANTARTRAATELACPEDKLEVTTLAGTSYRVEGCGKSMVYDCTVGNSVDPSFPDYACIPERSYQAAPSSSATTPGR
jgi:hypothetical protein